MASETKSSNAVMISVDALSPAQIEDKCEKIGVGKARMPFLASFMLAIVAGGAIGLGGMFFLVVLGDNTIGFAAQRLVGGLVFCIGLLLVVVAGAELFTGNTLIVISWINRQITTRDLLHNWTVVWIGNLVGSLVIAYCVFMSDFGAMNQGKVGAAILAVAIGKIKLSWMTIFFKAIMCNLMVCLAVWMAFGSRSTGDKVAVILLPIAGFVAAGFEHCVANMFFLPIAWMDANFGTVPAGLDVSVITLAGIVHNLIPATLGNIVGGAVFVGVVYWAIYRKSLGGLTPLPQDAPKGGVAVKG